MKVSEASEPTASESTLDPPPPAEARAKPLPRKLPLSPETAEAFALIPARMINEVLYCERLMYLEWVQGEWADNYFTADGRSVHKRADRAGRPLQAASEPLEDGEALPYTARSVWLSSEELGITAKIDVVDVDGRAVIPIEYKRGKRPNVPEGAYLPERAQICAQVLLLRQHGYSCSHGEIYYAKDHQRHPIVIDEQLVAQTKAAVARIRDLAARGELPPPLRDSPKCLGCSLVGICLPDETCTVERLGEALVHDSGPTAEPADVVVEPSTAEPSSRWQSVRRFLPARDDRVGLYVQEQGSAVRLSGERLIVQRKEADLAEARLSNTSHLAIYGNVQVTTQTLRALFERGIPLLYFSYGGWYLGRTLAADSKNVELRLAQYARTQSQHFCLRLARGFVASKVLNCRTLLRRNHPDVSPVVLSQLKQLARKARDCDAIASLLGIEGTAARVYFSELPGMLKGSAALTTDFNLERRNRRPPADPINALLSFSYSLLSKDVLVAVQATGLDPMLGFYHQPHFGRPALALDLMEEFRPVIADSVVVNALNTGVIQTDDFIRAAGSVALTAPARKRLIQAYERRMDQLVTHPVFDYRISYRRVLEVQARLLSRVLLGELQFYPEFRVR